MKTIYESIYIRIIKPFFAVFVIIASLLPTDTKKGPPEEEVPFLRSVQSGLLSSRRPTDPTVQNCSQNALY